MYEEVLSAGEHGDTGVAGKTPVAGAQVGGPQAMTAEGTWLRRAEKGTCGAGTAPAELQDAQRLQGAGLPEVQAVFGVHGVDGLQRQDSVISLKSSDGQVPTSTETCQAEASPETFAFKESEVGTQRKEGMKGR